MFKRGKVILVPFPFTDLTGQKIRPAVILSDPKRIKENVIVAFITSKTQKTTSKCHVNISKATSGFEASGLKTASLIRCDKIATLDKRIVLGEIGKLSAKLIREINTALQFTLGLK